ncbi:hypothetical protein KKH63_02240 [Patescibacteria group bacterium]|nr:hypothetical protein [Patescibacteria group bacterium]
MPPLAGGVLVAELLTDNYENISRQRQVVVVVAVVVRMGKIMLLVYLLANSCQWLAELGLICFKLTVRKEDDMTPVGIFFIVCGLIGAGVLIHTIVSWLRSVRKAP